MASNFETTGFGKKYINGGLGGVDTSSATPTQIVELENMRAAVEMAERDMEGTKPFEFYDIKATGYTVIYKPYDKNPYRRVAKITEGGLILPPEWSGRFKSNETGEMTEPELGIGWASVISAGPECKYVKEGDDICYRVIDVPVPFGGLGYRAISEQNVIAVTKRKNE